MAWVTNDGEYNGSSLVIEFDYDSLTPDQWVRLEEMSDSNRYDYVKAILDKHNLNVCEIEMEEFGVEYGLEDLDWVDE
jgi:hypothetical protein